MKPLFEADTYKKDQPKFFFVERNRQLQSSRGDTDNRTYAAGQGESSCPVWVWTLDNLTLSELK